MNFEIPKIEFNTNFNYKENKSSDKYKNKAKIFLQKNNIRLSDYNEKQLIILDNVLKLSLPKTGEQQRIRTQQQMNLISIILKIISVHKTIDELTISTYTFNRLSLKTIIQLVENKKIKKVNLFIASSYKFRNPEYYEELSKTILRLNKTHDIHLIFAWIHFKITLAKCKNNYYQHEGSMNYSTNNMAENLLFENNEVTYEHDYNFMQNIKSKENLKALDIIC